MNKKIVAQNSEVVVGVDVHTTREHALGFTEKGEVGTEFSLKT